MVSPVHGYHRRYQAETPLIDLFKFASPALDLIKMPFRYDVAKAGFGLQTLGILDKECFASSFHQARSLELLDHAAHVTSPNSQKHPELLMGKRHALTFGAHSRGDDPLCRALLDGMRRVTSRRLDDLCE